MQSFLHEDSALLSQALIGPWFPCLFLALAVIPLGGARSETALSWFTVLVSTAFCGAVFNSLARNRSQAPLVIELAGCKPLLLLALPAFVLLQALLQATVGFSDGPTLSLWQSTLTMFTLAAFFVLAHSATRDRHGFRFLLVAFMVIGAAEAVYGVLNLLAGNERLLIYERWMHFHSATGTFYSRNQFAFLMEIVLPISLAAGAIVVDIPHAGRHFRAQENEYSARKILIGTCSVAVALGLIFSRSRMGLFSVLAATLLVLGLNVVLRPDGLPAKPIWKMRTPLLLAGAILLYAAVIGFEPVIERFFRVEQDLEEARLPIWQATVAMAKDAPLLGHGWGTFEALLPAYRPRPTGTYFDHAHNDYLEFLAEGGIAALAIVSGMLFAFGRSLIRTLSTPMSQRQRTGIVALAIGIVAVLIHSTADFGLRVPAIAFFFVALVAVYARAIENPMLIDPDFDPSNSLPMPRSRRKRVQKAPS